MRDSFDPDEDFAPREERGQTSRKRAAAQKPKPLPLWRRLFATKRRASAVLLFGFAAVMAAGVSVNALFLQEGRHPAPIFQLPWPKAETPPRARPTAAQTPLPPARPTSIATAKSDSGETPKAETRTLDPIAQLIGGVAPKKVDATPAKSKTVLAAQKALARLGFVLHEDGVYGGTTREAVEKFERANGMPVKGELSPKILRLLSQRSGVEIK